MDLDPLTVTVVLAVALVLYVGLADRRSRRYLAIGLFIALASWTPILLAIVFDPDGSVVGNALGLGLLAWLGTSVGALTILFASALALVRRVLER